VFSHAVWTEQNTPYNDSHLGLNAIYEFMEAVCLFLLSTCLEERWCERLEEATTVMCWQSPWPRCDTLRCLVMYLATVWLPCVLQRWVSVACGTFCLLWIESIISRHTGDEDIASCVYSLDTRCKWVNSFTPLPLYSLRKRPKLHLSGRLGLSSVSTAFLSMRANILNLIRLEQTSIGVAIKQPLIERNRIW
jgi:hypothetical protein